MKLLVLAARHVHELLPYRECADVMREALAELARGQLQQPLRTIVRPLTRGCQQVATRV